MYDKIKRVFLDEHSVFVFEYESGSVWSVVPRTVELRSETRSIEELKKIEYVQKVRTWAQSDFPTPSRAEKTNMNKLTEEQIARICHEANRAYCLAIGDASQLAWDDAPEWQRMSATKGVVAGATPEQSHASWLQEKAATGWVYGPVKDADQKTHPCMVPYDQLPEEQQVKDRLFRAIVDALLPNDVCPGAGRCHGPQSHCDCCGDTRSVCDVFACDWHAGGRRGIG